MFISLGLSEMIVTVKDTRKKKYIKILQTQNSRPEVLF